MDLRVAPDTDALQLDTRFVALYESVLSVRSVVNFYFGAREATRLR
jgi:hypothetical protein